MCFDHLTASQSVSQLGDCHLGLCESRSLGVDSTPRRFLQSLPAGSQPGKSSQRRISARSTLSITTGQLHVRSAATKQANSSPLPKPALLISPRFSPPGQFLRVVFGCPFAFLQLLIRLQPAHFPRRTPVCCLLIPASHGTPPPFCLSPLSPPVLIFYCFDTLAYSCMSIL